LYHQKIRKPHKRLSIFVLNFLFLPQSGFVQQPIQRDSQLCCKLLLNKRFNFMLFILIGVTHKYRLRKSFIILPPVEQRSICNA
jgi:hypothetical protein